MNVLFIDSGIGGISTLCTCVQHMPNLNFIYYADNKYAPYGNLSTEQITSRICSIINSQLKHNIGLVVIACNTATACSIDTIRGLYKIPIVGTEPAIKPACNNKDNNVIVFATPATAVNPRILRLTNNSPCNIDIVALPKLARLIDSYFLYGDIASHQQIEQELKNISKLSANKTHIVLGCTHYIFLKEEILKATKCTVLDGNVGVCKQLKRLVSNKFSSPRPTQKFVFSLQNSDLCKNYRKIFEQTLAKRINVW